MLCIRNNITDPYFNLAAEEYFLKESGQEFFILYINDPSVIIGKHQNAYAEINLDYIRENNITVVRRISGGGAVWHDHGNLNFSFIRKGKEGELVNFRKYTSPILDVLLKLGLNAEFTGKNSISINGLKVSGIAEHIYKNRVLHHGTLLFKSDISSLSEALQINPMKYRDRAVKSVRSQTANISEFLKNKIGIREFMDRLLEYVMNSCPGSELYHLSASDHDAVQQLAKDKYSTWEWNFGYSPRYVFDRKVIISGHYIGVFMQVEKGLIVEVKLSSDIFPESLKEKLESLLLQQKHNENVINELLDHQAFEPLLELAGKDQLVKAFF